MKSENMRSIMLKGGRDEFGRVIEYVVSRIRKLGSARDEE
jgi:hypothetical protein